MLNQGRDEHRFDRLLRSSEWEFTRECGKNPLEYSDMHREEFADKVLFIMGNREFDSADKAAEIDTLLFNVTQQATRNLAQKRYDLWDDVDEDDLVYASTLMPQGSDGL